MVTKTIDFGLMLLLRHGILQFENKMKFSAVLSEISGKSPRKLESAQISLCIIQRFQDDVDSISSRI
jgi:hypothetical protein